MTPDAIKDWLKILSKSLHLVLEVLLNAKSKTWTVMIECRIPGQYYERVATYKDEVFVPVHGYIRHDGKLLRILDLPTYNYQLRIAIIYCEIVTPLSEE